MWIQFWQKQSRSGAMYLDRRDFLLDSIEWIFQIISKAIFFCFHTIGVRRSIDVLFLENQSESGSGSMALGLTRDVGRLMYENKKECFWNYLEYLFYRILKISLPLRYKPLDPVFGQNGIHITVRWSVWNNIQPAAYYYYTMASVDLMSQQITLSYWSILLLYVQEEVPMLYSKLQYKMVNYFLDRR